MRAAGMATQAGRKHMGLSKAEAVDRTGKQGCSSWILPIGEEVKASWVGRLLSDQAEVLVGGPQGRLQVIVLTAFAFTLSCLLFSWLLPFCPPLRNRVEDVPLTCSGPESHTPSGPRFHISGNLRAAACSGC